MTKPQLIDKSRLVQLVRERIAAKDDFWEEEMNNDLKLAEEADQVCKSMFEDEAQLDRLLIARKYNASKTRDLFFDQVRFRARVRPTQIDPSGIANALFSGAWRLCGYTKDGHVMSNYKLEHWNPDNYSQGDSANLEDAVQEYTLYTTYMIELMIASMKPPHDKFVVIFDLKGFYLSMVTKTNVRLMIRKLIYIAQAQYPERLHKVYLVNAPFGFETAWKLIRPLLDERTAVKIQFANQESIAEDVDPSVLSVTYGGLHEEYPIPSKSIHEEAYKS